MLTCTVKQEQAEITGFCWISNIFWLCICFVFVLLIYSEMVTPTSGEFSRHSRFSTVLDKLCKGVGVGYSTIYESPRQIFQRISQGEWYNVKYPNCLISVNVTKDALRAIASMPCLLRMMFVVVVVVVVVGVALLLLVVVDCCCCWWWWWLFLVVVVGCYRCCCCCCCWV